MWHVLVIGSTSILVPRINNISKCGEETVAATKIKYNSTLWQRYNCDTTPWSPPSTSKNDTQPRGSVLLYVLFFPQDFVICKPCDIVRIQLSLKSCNRKNVVLSNQWQLQVWLRSSIPRMWSHHCWLCHTHKKLSKPIVHPEILRTNVSNNSANSGSLTKHPHVSITFFKPHKLLRSTFGRFTGFSFHGFGLWEPQSWSFFSAIHESQGSLGNQWSA